MTTLGVLLLAVAMGLTFYYFSFVKGKAPSLEERNKLAAEKAKELRASKGADDLKLANISTGAVLGLTGIGPDLIDLDVKVLGRNLYRCGPERWHEAEIDAGTKKYFLTFTGAPDERPEVTLDTPDVGALGIDEADLEKAVKEDDAPNVKFKGLEFEFDDTYMADFCPGQNELAAEQFRVWEFIGTQDKNLAISIIRWNDGSYEASFDAAIPLSHVTIYSIS